jgi:hypothetical protein
VVALLWSSQLLIYPSQRVIDAIVMHAVPCQFVQQNIFRGKATLPVMLNNTLHILAGLRCKRNVTYRVRRFSIRGNGISFTYILSVLLTICFDFFPLYMDEKVRKI